MGKAGSVFSMGSGGATYEHHIQAAYLLAMILKIEVPLAPKGEISEVAFQTTSRGYETDDLYVEIDLGAGVRQKFLAQIKHNVALTETSKVFNEVISAFWKDFNNTNFVRNTDRLLLIKSHLTINDKKHIGVLLDWASTHKDEKDFYSEVNRIAIKKQHLKIFETLLKKANGNKTVSEKEVWEFLNCMALLSYDFTTEASIQDANVLNLITLSKAKDCSSTAIQIWNELLALASKYNHNGGSLNLNDCIRLDIYKYFNPSVFDETYNTIIKLKQDGKVILEPFNNRIKDFHFDRRTQLNALSEILDEKQITIITGGPGAGKSALLKEFIENSFANSYVFIFKAEQFNESNLSHVFSKLGISCSITDVLSSIGYLKEKIVVIDSLEKLLEADAENAFQQFLAQIKSYRDVKIICTSRSYAVNLLIEKYRIEAVNFLELKPLSDAELDIALKHFPELIPYYKNNGIKELLRSPKYLEFAVNTIGIPRLELKNLSLIDFKSKLWNHVIEKYTVVEAGKARKRGKAFLNIALKRAQSMRLFVEPDDQIDEEAIEKLVDDNILFKNVNEYKFAPTHDILEDWALIKHISKLKSDVPAVEPFFTQIGSQPALRRAFRLWMEDYLIDETDSIVNLIRSTIGNRTIEKYWIDEILISVFRSKDASPFFVNFKEELLAQNCAFLGRCIVLARTACKEYSHNTKMIKPVLFPVGSVWKELLIFISENIRKTADLRESILLLLMDWEFTYIFDKDNLSIEEITACKNIAVYYISELEYGETYWIQKMSRERDTIKGLIYLFYGFAPFAKKEIEDFFERSNSFEKITWQIQGFYEQANKLALSGLRNGELVKEFPELLISLTEQHWKIQPEEQVEEVKIKGHRSVSNFLPPSKQTREDAWGIANSKFDFYPSGIYKTFAYSLFRTHPVTAITFVTNFINYSVDYYSNSEYGKENPLQEVTLHFEDGKQKTQYGDSDLWSAYRGTGRTHTLLECLLMTLEDYLLTLANEDRDLAQKLLEEHIKYLLQFSNNTALTSIVSSVFMANPKAITKIILPIFGVKEFYEWDLNRAISEIQCLAPPDNNIQFAQKERIQSNSLEHRRKYPQGLRGFMMLFQINQGIFNIELFEIYDRFYNEYKDDHLWIKTVTEMDVRKLKPGKINAEEGTIELIPLYPEDITKTLNEISKDFQDHNIEIGYNNLLLQVSDDKTEMSFEQWEEIYNFYTAPDFKKGMFDMPVSLATIGLNVFNERISESQKIWSLDTFSEALTSFIIDKYKIDYSFGMPAYNILEKKTILHSIHLLLKFSTTEEIREDYKILLTKLVLCPFEDTDLREFLMYFRTTFTQNCSQVAIDLKKAMISFAKFEVDNPRPSYKAKEEELKIYKANFEDFILVAIKGPEEIESDLISFETHEKHFLFRSMLMISTKENESYEVELVIKILQDFVNLHKINSEDDWHHNKREIEYTILIDLQLFLAELIIYNDEIEVGKNILDILICPFTEGKYNTDTSIAELYKFVESTLDFCVTIMYDVFRENTQAEAQKLDSRFWELWQFVVDVLKEKNLHSFNETLLLDNRFLKSVDDWSGFLNKKEQYLKMANYFGLKNLSPILSVFSTFGEKMFLPEGVILLEKLVKENPANAASLINKEGKLLTQKLFANHINSIKDRQDLVNAFLFILGVMIDLGSTEAYIIRENVIVYKVK